MFSSSWFTCNEIAQLQICIWSHTFAQIFLPVIEHLALFRRGHHSPSALLSKSISEGQATYLWNILLMQKKPSHCYLM